MRTYTELQQEFDTRAKRIKTTNEARAAGQSIYIAANFLKDNHIEPEPIEQARESTAEALERYEPEERAAFADALQVYFDTMNAITSKFRRGRQ